MIDPTLNPDGRDRHTHWVNTYKGSPLVDDPQDAEHNEYWPGGRTNHYWFDLNRDWYLGIHPRVEVSLNGTIHGNQMLLLTFMKWVQTVLISLFHLNQTDL